MHNCVVVEVGYPIPQEKIEEVRHSIDLVELAMEYLTLKKKGKNFVGKCPFHNEKTPSFTVSPEKQIYHCFGCGAGGNAFTLVMQQDDISFPEAVSFLAKKAGISLPEKELTPLQKKQLTENEKLREINEIALSYFRKKLSHKWGEKARDYLEKRGIRGDMIEVYKLGYAPQQCRELIGYLLKDKGYPFHYLQKSGLFFTSDEGEVRSRFRNRLIFPIWDPRGRVIGFGGRILGPGEPKYLNSPETPLFKKSESLYGFHLALQAIRDEGKALVVEGYIDVITAYSFGFKNAVASLGTSFTEKQAELLRLRTEEVIIAYDADTGGKAATLRGMKILKDKGLNVKVASLPVEKDPDDLLRQEGADAFQGILNRARPFLDYQLDVIKEEHSLETREGRIKYWQEAKNLLLTLTDLVEREDYLKKVAADMKVPLDAVRKELDKQKKPSRQISRRGKENNKSMTGYNQDPLVKTQKELLEIILGYPETIKKVKDFIEPDLFTHRGYRKIVNEILTLYEKDNKLEIAKLYHAFSEEDLHKLISELSFGKKEEYEGKVQKIAFDCLNKLKGHHIATERKIIERALQEAESNGDISSIDNLLKKWLAVKNTEKSVCRSGEGEKYHG